MKYLQWNIVILGAIIFAISEILCCAGNDCVVTQTVCECKEDATLVMGDISMLPGSGVVPLGGAVWAHASYQATDAKYKLTEWDDCGKVRKRDNLISQIHVSSGYSVETGSGNGLTVSFVPTQVGDGAISMWVAGVLSNSCCSVNDSPITKSVSYCVEGGPYVTYQCLQPGSLSMTDISVSPGHIIRPGETITASAMASSSNGTATKKSTYDCQSERVSTVVSAVTKTGDYRITGAYSGAGQGLSVSFTPAQAGEGAIEMTVVGTSTNCPVSPSSITRTQAYYVAEVDVESVGDICACRNGNCAPANATVHMKPSSISGQLTITLLDEQNSPVMVLYSETDKTGDMQIPWDATVLGPGEYSLLAEWNLGSLTCSKQTAPFGVLSLENMRVQGDNYPVSPGDAAQMLVDANFDEGRTLVWMITDAAPDDNKIPLRAAIDSQSGLVTIDPKSGTGWLTIRVEDSGYGTCCREAHLYVGCPCAGGCSSIPGGGYVNIGSVDIRIGLGGSRAGKSAGELFLRSDALTTNIYTPSALIMSTLDPSVQTRLQDGSLRQIKAPHALIDVVTNSAADYSLVFYRSEDVTGTNANGLYMVVSNADPISTWRIYNPDPNTNQYERLAVDEVVGSNTKSFMYEWDAVSNTWSLLRAGLQKETREVEQAGEFRIETTTLADTNGAAASVVEKTFATIGSSEVVVSEVVDPGGVALRTEYQYQTNAQLPGYGLQTAVTYPNGSWARYGYDQDGRTTNEVKSWLNAPPNASPANAREIRYSYAPVDPEDVQLPEDRLRPRTEAEYIASVPVSISYHAYMTNEGGGRVEIAEQAKAGDSTYGQTGNLRTVREYYPDLGDDPASLKLKTATYPDGRQDSFEYVSGTYVVSPAPGTFTAGTGSNRMETVTHGTALSPEGIQFKATREVSIYDDWNRQVARYSEVLTGEGYELLDWTTYEHDEWGRVTEALRSNGERTEAAWDCCGMTWQADEQGIETVYVRDGLGRTVMEIRGGVTNAFVYDAAGRTLENRRRAGGIALVESNKYDRAGRLLEHEDSADLKTIYEYRDGGVVTVQTLPSGGVQVTSQYQDGQMLSVTGTAVVASFYEYGVDTNGTRWTLARAGADDSPMWEKSVTDMLGRTVRTERPAFGGTTSAVESFYDEYGRLATNRQSNAIATVDTLYSYDELGQVIRSGIDANGNGILDTGGMDRVGDSDQYYGFDGTNWWSVTKGIFYPYDNSELAATSSVSRTRVTGLGTISGDGILVSERTEVDFFGNTTAFRRIVDRDNAMAWETADLPASIQDIVRVYSNGNMVSGTSASGVVVSNVYDAIGRLTETRSGGGGRETGRIVHYNSQGKVEWEEDLAGNRTTYSYDSETGFKVAVTDALTNTVHTAYDLQGLATNTWGATYPVAYEYDAYGRMSAMKTWRDTNGAPDVTRWNYDEATGLLTNKVYADGRGPSYEYDAGGRLAIRIWARGVSTDYSYDSLGQMTAIDYSDDTPDVSFTYDRLGRQKTVTDVLGTRTNVYDAASLKEERMSNGTTLARSYDTFGRASGISLEPDFAVGYGYDDYGRLSMVWPSNNGERVDYAYVPGSDLVAGWGVSNGASAAYVYEPNRDVRTNVSNKFGSTPVSGFAYAYDPVGRRTQRVDSEAVTNAFGYNIRSELTDALMGTSQYDYAYDPIGNRTQASLNEETNAYWSNELNQYTNVNAGEIKPTYDEDGNMISMGGKDYTWDAENRLVRVRPHVLINGVKGWDYAYDYMGRRVAKVESHRVLGSWIEDWTKTYEYDGWNMIRETKIEDPTPIQVLNADLSSGLTNWGASNAAIINCFGSSAARLNSTNASIEQTIDIAPREKYAVSLRYNPHDCSGSPGYGVVYHSLNVQLGDAQAVISGSYAPWLTWGSMSNFTFTLCPMAVAETVRFVNAGMTMGVVDDISVTRINEHETTYVWGLDLSGSLQGAGGVGGLLTRYVPVSNALDYVFCDANGNVTELVDTNGNVDAHYEYDPYGNVTAQSGDQADANPFRFSTKYWDEEMGFCYFGYRYYSPQLGRWINRDPMEEQGGLNLYGFVQNEPVSLVDALGLEPSLYLIVGPDIGNTSDAFTPGPAVSLSDLQGRVNAAKAAYARDSGTPCKIKVLTAASSVGNPMDKQRLQRILASTGNADAIAMVFHGQREGSETGIILFHHWHNPLLKWAKGKAYHLNDIVTDQSQIAASIDELFISCCYSAGLAKHAGGKRIIPFADTQGTQPKAFFLAGVYDLVKDLCCRNDEQANLSKGISSETCCPVQSGK